MNRTAHLRLALCGALAAALMLSACGRKGPLDAPPSSLGAPVAGAASGPAQVQPDDGDSRPLAPQGQKRRIPADVLLD